MGTTRYSRSDFGPILRVHVKIKESGFVFVVKFNKVNVEYRFLFFVPTRMLHIVNFASNTINGRPRYSRSLLEYRGRPLIVFEAKLTICNILVGTKNKNLYSTMTLLNLTTKTFPHSLIFSCILNIGPKSLSDFGPILRIHEKIKE